MSAPNWDSNSAIRERLALLAKLGPAGTNPADWLYNPTLDHWSGVTACVMVKVGQEGSKSLEMIERRYGMDRKAAMRFIGYTED